MNPGPDPGRDDSGLPPVDIEIPDDARELDRDVLAYRREIRARRRQARLRRMLGPIRGHSAILPLIASCVALSMLAGALLSVFTISPASAPVVGRSAPPGIRAVPAPSGGAGSPRLPSGTVLVDGKRTPLHRLASAVLALVPAGCGCDAALRQLTADAARAGVRVFYVGRTASDVNRLVRADGQGVARAVTDTANLLRSAYKPAGLTAVLVGPDSATTVRRGLTSGFRLSGLSALSTVPGTAPGSPVPGAT